MESNKKYVLWAGSVLNEYREAYEEVYETGKCDEFCIDCSEKLIKLLVAYLQSVLEDPLTSFKCTAQIS